MTQGYTNADWQARFTDPESTYTPAQVFTAEDDIKTDSNTVLTGQDLSFGTIVALNGANKLVPWDPDTAAVAQPVGVLAADMDTSGGDAEAPIYVGGCFNPDVLTWPASLTTFKARRDALMEANVGFRVKRLL